MQFFNKLKTKAEDLSFKAQSAMAIGLMTAMAPIESAFADTKINSNVPTVNSDGSVTLKVEQPEIQNKQLLNLWVRLSSGLVLQRQ